MPDTDWSQVHLPLHHSATEHALVVVGILGGELHPIGSAVFVAPQLVMTARHVVDEFYKRADRPIGRGQGEVVPFQIRIVQFADNGGTPAWWAGTAIWRAAYTDACFISVRPNCEISRAHHLRLPQVSVVAPPIGECVVAIGYPKSAVLGASSGGTLTALNPTAVVGRVTANYDHFHTRGFLDFPCFEVRAQYGGGMSGGPVYNEAGQLCGLVCAGDDDHAIAWCVTFWAALGTPITHDPNGIQLPISQAVWHFINKQGRLIGFEQVSSRIVEEEDPMGRKTIRLQPKPDSPQQDI